MLGKCYIVLKNDGGISQYKLQSKHAPGVLRVDPQATKSVGMNFPERNPSCLENCRNLTKDGQLMSNAWLLALDLGILANYMDTPTSGLELFDTSAICSQKNMGLVSARYGQRAYQQKRNTG